MARKQFIFHVLAAAISFFILGAVSIAAADADADESLTGLWGMTGSGVGYSGGIGDVFLLRLGADGKAVVTNYQGCMIISSPATWKTEGSTLRLIPVAKPAEDAGGGYSYSVDGTSHKVNNWWDKEVTFEYAVDGNVLILRNAGEKNDEKLMVLTRREEAPRNYTSSVDKSEEIIFTRLKEGAWL